MAAAIEKEVLSHDYEASGDLSAYRGYFVKFDGNGRIAVCTEVTDDPLGVLMNEDCNAAGKTAHVCHIGIVPVVCTTGGIALAARVGPDTDGKGVAKTIGGDTTHYAPGKAVYAGSATNAMATVYVNAIAGRAA